LYEALKVARGEYIGFLFKDTVACVCVISILANMVFPPDEIEK